MKNETQEVIVNEMGQAGPLHDDDVKGEHHELGGTIPLPNGGELHYTRNQESSLWIDKLNHLARSLKNVPCLPTEVLFKDQDPEALALTRKYIEGITKNVEILKEFGGNKSLASYSFRLPHLINLETWLNVVVRLQFATSFKIILDTLNDNLTPGTVNRWGVLEKDEDGFHINGQRLYYGDVVDVFTTDETILGKVIFDTHGVLNCKEIDGHSAPVFHLSKEQMDNMSQASLVARATAKTPPSEHLLGTDAWSFLHGLFYRISNDEEEVIEITTDIFTKLDYAPSINVKDYIKIATRLSEEDLPYGLNQSLLTGLRDYYCKDYPTYMGFVANVRKLYDVQAAFRQNLNSQAYVKALTGHKSFTITGIYDLLRLVEGNSKLLRVKLVMMDGTMVDAVTVTRPMTLGLFGSFNRFNPAPIYFQKIEYTDKVKSNFMSRMSDIVSGKKQIINKDNFVLTDDVIRSEDVVGFINSESKAYYFAEDSTLEKDDKFAMYHKLAKKFKRLSKGME